MKFRNLIIAAFAVLMASCSAKTTAQQEAADEMDNFEISIVEKSADAKYLCVDDSTFGPDVKLYTTVSAKVQWPQRLGNSDIKCLQDSLLAGCFASNAAGTIEEAMARYIADPLTMDDNTRLEKVDIDTIEEGARELSLEVEAKLMRVGSQYAVYELYSFYYGGGAHPLYSSSFITYDVQQGKVLGIDDVIIPGNGDKLVDAIKQVLLDRCGATTEDELTERTGISPDAIAYSLEKPVFYLNDYNVVFYFNPYEIRPWVIGAVDVPVPVFLIEDIVQPRVKELLGLV